MEGHARENHATLAYPDMIMIQMFIISLLVSELRWRNKKKQGSPTEVGTWADRPTSRAFPFLSDQPAASINHNQKFM
jgi:hypothetical protein